MSNSNLLYVPMEVKALAVNNEVSAGNVFQRWQMDFSVLPYGKSPVQPPFSGGVAVQNGIYLHWTLPDSIRHGAQPTPGSPMQFPLVPNRWLVVRYNGPLTQRTATAWVIESDFLDPNNGTSPYVQAGTNGPQPTMIGRQVSLSSWSETGTQELFLTAVGPGDISFASFQSNVGNVFSIFDPYMDANNNPLYGATDTMSYFIAGWYSDPTKDILTVSGAAFADVLTALNWATDNANLSANQTICHSMVHGVQWNFSGPQPVSGKPLTADDVSIAVGNTSIDALTALITSQVKTNSGTSIDPGLLEAFQYNLLSQLDQPNGPALVDHAIHKAWYGSKSGGYEWVIAKTQSTSSSPQSSPADDPNLNPAWLLTLNEAQLAYDQAVEALTSLQWQLYALWSTSTNFSSPLFSPREKEALQYFNKQLTAQNFATQLDATQAGSFAAQVQQQQQTVASLLAGIPSGLTQEALNASALTYANTNTIAAGYFLKRTSKKSHFEANNPVVLISGAKTSAPLTVDAALQCRFASELVTGFTFNGTTVNASALQSVIPNPGLSNLPYDLTALFNEFFLLDPANATVIATTALGKTDQGTIQSLANAISAYTTCTGNLPAFDLTTWVQPWQPLYLMWQVDFYPIAHDTNNAENWQFDGTQYNWNGMGGNQSPVTLNGRIFLTPQSGFNFKSRIQDYINNHPALDNTALTNLSAMIDATDNWDFLSQSLDGFMQQLASKSVMSNLSPGDPVLSMLIGDQNSMTPNLGAIPGQQGFAPSAFQQFRSGQFAFSWVQLVDRFGQVLEVLNPTTAGQFIPVPAPDMQPVKTVLANDTYTFVELKPRLLQPARLNFDFVSSTDDTKIVKPGSSENPVCAWVITNHIDRALTCYDNTGMMLGEMNVVMGISGTPQVNWQGGPSGNFNTLAQVAATYLHLGQMLNGLMTGGADAFQNFYEAVDATMWTIDPLGNRDDQNLSVLIGRPLALVRCRLAYELKGSPLSDPSWQFVFNPQAAEFVNYNFPVRLGELALRDDGLMGYFNGTDYSNFNCVYVPDDITPAYPPYLDLIAPGNFIPLQFNNQSEAFVTLLMDPRASVHATTSILPIESVSIPARFVDPVLSKMSITFNAGPLLSNLSSSGNSVSIVMPAPIEKNGEWSWLTPVSGQSYSLQASDGVARFQGDAPVLRSGILQLGGDLG